MPPNHTSQDEARLLWGLRHPQIITTYGIATALRDGMHCIYFVSELCVGSLDEYLSYDLGPSLMRPKTRPQGGWGNSNSSSSSSSSSGSGGSGSGGSGGSGSSGDSSGDSSGSNSSSGSGSGSGTGSDSNGGSSGGGGGDSNGGSSGGGGKPRQNSRLPAMTKELHLGTHTDHLPYRTRIHDPTSIPCNAMPCDCNIPCHSVPHSIFPTILVVADNSCIQALSILFGTAQLDVDSYHV
jgi:hypothetical protein